jgi:hypothetical protein
MNVGGDLPTPNLGRNETVMITMLQVFFSFLAPVGPQPVLRILGDDTLPGERIRSSNRDTPEGGYQHEPDR